jgi:hypothetical protein
LVLAVCLAWLVALQLYNPKEVIADSAIGVGRENFTRAVECLLRHCVASSASSCRNTSVLLSAITPERMAPKSGTTFAKVDFVWF